MTDIHADNDDEFDDEVDYDDEDYDDDYEEYDDEEALTEVGEAAVALREILLKESSLANSGSINALTSAVRAKKDAWTLFRSLSSKYAKENLTPTLADRAALEALVEAARENALILDAVSTTINDFNDKLRTALTESADPGIYGPKGKGVRHAMAAKFDTKI